MSTYTGDARSPRIGFRFVIDRGDDYGRTAEVTGFDNTDGAILCAFVEPEHTVSEKVGATCMRFNPAYFHEYVRGGRAE